MSIFRSYFSKNNTLIEDNFTNNSQNPVTEIAYGTLSSEVTRFILDVDFEPLKQRIAQGIINQDRIVKHVLHLTNTIRYDEEYLNKYMSDGATHRASSFDLELFNLDEEWDEGSGYEFIYDDEAYIISPTGASNWVDAKSNVDWLTEGAHSSGSTILGLQHFEKGNEDILIDVTGYVNAQLGTGSTSTGIGIKFTDDFEATETLHRQAVAFFARKTHTFFEPHIETIYEDTITDDRNYFFLDKDNELYLYANVGANPDSVTVNSVAILDYLGQTVSTLTGSSIENVGLGVYKIVVNIDSDTYPDAVLFTDRWNVTQNGKNKVIDQEFYLISQDSYFNFELSNRINFDNYSFNYFGIREGERIKDNNIRRIEVNVKQLYPNQANNVPLDVEYRLYNSQTDHHQFDVIPWTKVNRTFKGYSLLLDFSWLIPQDYTLEFRLINDNTFMVKEPLNFTVVSDGITTPATGQIPATTTTTTLPPTTTTTTTTLPPTDTIFISVTPTLSATTYTNRDNPDVSGDSLQMYWTTNPNSTQKYGTGIGAGLAADSIYRFEWLTDDSPQVNFFATAACCISGITAGVITGGTSYDLTLKAGDCEGYVEFNINNSGTGATVGNYTVSASNVVDPTKFLGREIDSTDTNYTLATTAGTTYGYDELFSNCITYCGFVVK